MAWLASWTTAVVGAFCRTFRAPASLVPNGETYRTIIESLPDSLNAKDRNGRFIIANPATARQMQVVSQNDLIGRTDFSFYTLEMAQLFRAQEYAVLSGTVVGPLEEHVLLPDGTERWLSTLKTPLRDPSGRVSGVITHNRDITDRKRLEIELAETQAHLNAAISNMADGLVLFDRNGTIRFCNQQYRSLFPQTADLRIEGSNLAGIIRAAVERGEEAAGGDIEAFVAARMSSLFHAGSRLIELGDGRLIEARTRPLASGETIVAFTDVTERQRSDSQAREANRQLRMAEEVAHVGHWRLDVSAQTLFWSDEVYRIFGLDPASYVPDVATALACYHADDRKDVERCVAEALGTGKAYVFSLRAVRPDGEIRHVHSKGLCETSANGDITAIFGTVMDVTELRQAERAAVASEERYRLLTETTTDVITQLDLMMRRTYVSPASLRVLGYPPEDMLGHTPWPFIHPDDVDSVRDLCERLAQGSVAGDRGTAIYRLRHKQGAWVWMEVALTLMRDTVTQRPLSLICSLRDVTERQHAAHQLEKAKAAAEEVARIKTEFVANMSHELRTPLTGIMGVHDLLRCDPGLSDAQRRLLGLAGEAGASLLRIVNDVLDFSKIEAGQMSIEALPFDLADLLAACQGLGTQAAKGKPVEVRAVLHPELPSRVVGDPTRIRQILLALINNAVKFTERGDVTIDAAYRWRDGVLRIDVMDTGIGIPCDNIETLFDRFTQADGSIVRRHGGTGLGLAIAKRLTELMGGQIGVLPSSNGAHLWFDLPLQAIDHKSSSLHGHAMPASSSDRCHHLLLAEDNDISAEIIRSMLGAQGYRVTTVADGAAALQTVFTRSDIDLVLMDLQMPVRDGFSATAAIRAHEASCRSRAVPIVGLTANAFAEDAERCLAAGMNAHVAKPIVWPTLFATIKHALQSIAASEPSAAPGDPTQILDLRTLNELAGVIGRERLDEMLNDFLMTLERQMSSLRQMTDPALLAYAHNGTSMAGHFGFEELSQAFANVQDTLRQGSGGDGISLIQAAGQRAIAVARDQGYATAA